MRINAFSTSLTVGLALCMAGCSSDGSETDSPTQVDDSSDSAQPSNPNNESDTSDQADAGEEISVYLSATDDCPERGYFLDVGSFEGPGPSYDAPRLEVSCDDENLMVSANGLPHYSFVQTTPNALRSQNFNWVVPRFPELAMATSTIPLLGTVAFSVNGVPIYGPNEAQFPDPFGDPVYNDLLDECLGHTGGQGDYHYHAMFVRCLSAIGLEGVEDRSVPSPILGYALDGFPIYGPLGCVDDACTSVVEFKSGWVQTGDPTTYAWDNHAYQPSDAGDVLDACNGRIGPDGTYRYHATATFPYVLGCYAGVVTDTGAGNNAGGGGGGGAGGGGMGPTSCEEESDCDAPGACPTDLGCACSPTPMGQACIPTCNVDADCDFGSDRELICGDQGLCVPQN
ncbi:MAG: YHYH protein [Myxococcota bacterium]|nr:YHYH protein [Myxococcota bacterium]